MGRRWSAASAALLRANAGELAALPIDHAVRVAAEPGKPASARTRLRHFLDTHLAHYSKRASHPDADGCSGLSAYLHFGHLSVHEVFAELVACEQWSRERLAAKPTGKREGWWGISGGAEAYLDELVTW